MGVKLLEFSLVVQLDKVDLQIYVVLMSVKGIYLHIFGGDMRTGIRGKVKS